MPILFTPDSLKQKLELRSQEPSAPAWLKQNLSLLAEKPDMLIPEQKKRQESAQFIYFH